MSPGTEPSGNPLTRPTLPAAVGSPSCTGSRPMNADCSAVHRLSQGPKRDQMSYAARSVPGGVLQLTNCRLGRRPPPRPPGPRQLPPPHDPARTGAATPTAPAADHPTTPSAQPGEAAQRDPRPAHRPPVPHPFGGAHARDSCRSLAHRMSATVPVRHSHRTSHSPDVTQPTDAPTADLATISHETKRGQKDGYRLSLDWAQTDMFCLPD